MIGAWIRFGFCAFFTAIGLAAMIAAVIGVYRFKDPLCKMQAAAMIDTLAFSSFIIAAAIAWGFGIEDVKMALAIFFLWMTSPVSSHLLSRLEYMTRGGSTEGVELPGEDRDGDLPK